MEWRKLYISKTRVSVQDWVGTLGEFMMLLELRPWFLFSKMACMDFAGIDQAREYTCVYYRNKDVY